MRVGQFRVDPLTKCSYKVCDYGSEPWKDSFGNIKLFSRSMPCAPGTHVPDMVGLRSLYEGINPCSARHDGACPGKQS